MIRKVLLTAALIIGIAAAPAAAQYDSLVISPGQGRAGDTITFSGTGCAAGEEVVISIRHRNGTTYEVARVIADADGNFSGSFIIPDVPNGRYDVISSCGTVLAGALEVLADEDPGPTPPPGTTPPPGATPPGQTGPGAGAPPAGTGRSGPLPATGSDFNTLGLVGLALLAAGGLVLLTTRSRSTRTA